MGFTEIFRKYMMKNGRLPKISILLQYGVKILALPCFSNSIQILVILSLFQTDGTKTKLQVFVWSHCSMKGPISHPQTAIRC